MMKTAKTARTVILTTLGWSLAESVTEHYAATPSSEPLPEADGVRQQLDVGARPVPKWWIELGIEAGHGPFQSVVGATVRRFRPIIFTVAAAVLGPALYALWFRVRRDVDPSAAAGVAEQAAPA